MVPQDVEGGDSLTQSSVRPIIRVLLASSDPILNIGMNLILAGEDDMHVVEHVETLHKVDEAIARSPVDIVVIQRELLSKPTELIPPGMQNVLGTKLIVHVAPAEQADKIEFYRSGFLGVVHRSITPELFVKCIRRVANGEIWIDNASISRIINVLSCASI